MSLLASAITHSTLLLIYFLGYGVFEREFNAGYQFAFCFCSCIGYCKGKLFLSLMIHALLYLTFHLLVVNEVVYYFLYLSSNLYIIFGQHAESNEAKVSFLPYEREIRQLLFRFNPSSLHRVDKWLLQNKGKERVVLQKIARKYDPDHSFIDGKCGYCFDATATWRCMPCGHAFCCDSCRSDKLPSYCLICNRRIYKFEGC